MSEVNLNQNAGGIIGSFQTGSIDHTYNIGTLNLVNNANCLSSKLAMINTFHPSTPSLIIKNNNLTESAKRYANFISREPNLSYLVVTNCQELRTSPKVFGSDV